MKKTAIIAAAASLAAGCASAVQVPGNLAPRGESLAQIVPARGVQIYECRDGKWAFVAPEADLFDHSGKKIGKHYAGPHWEAADGSKVVAKLTARAPAPAADADIPWLLLTAKSVGPKGAFSEVSSIQRVSTAGGIAPAGGCSEPGARARVPYTADYYLFVPR